MNRKEKIEYIRNCNYPEFSLIPLETLPEGRLDQIIETIAKRMMQEEAMIMGNHFTSFWLCLN